MNRAPMNRAPMHRGIATVSLSGLLTEKLDAVAAAGFDGVEIFDNDLIASPLSPRDIAKLCADLGLSIDLFQPIRDVEGLSAADFLQAERRVRHKLAIAAELGAPTVLVCSSVRPDSIDDVDLSALQLSHLGDLAAEVGVTIAYEALAWGRHVNRVAQAWRIVEAAAHPSVTLAVDTFHMLSRGDGAKALAGVPGDRIGFLQVADAPVLDMNVLEWSRHHRCFPGQGTMPIADLVGAVLDAGYTGPVSLEVFSDVVREAPVADTAQDAFRSLAYLEDEVLRRSGATPRAVPSTPRQVDAAFIELTASPSTEDVLTRLGFTLAGWHRNKPVAWWQNGGASVLVNGAADSPSIGVAAAPVRDVADRAHALHWPDAPIQRADGDTPLPGLASPAGTAIFVSGEGEDDWRRDFTGAPTRSSGWLGIDHVGLTVAPSKLNEEVAFLRTLLGLRADSSEEFIQPHGRLRSRAFRPDSGDLRVVLNVIDGDRKSVAGITQLAFACDDLRAEVRRLRSVGTPLLAVPDNYYADLEARYDLEPTLLNDLKSLGIMYDRGGDGEMLHVYTPVLPQGFYIELLERRGGYSGYGATNTPIRLALQA